MVRREQPNQHELLEVMRLLADVAALKSAPAAQRKCLIDGLNAMVGANTGFLYVADQWLEGAPAHFSHYTLSSHPDPAFERHAAEFGTGFPPDEDPYCYASIRDVATSKRTLALSDALPDRAANERHATFIDLARTVRLQDGAISYYRTGPANDRIIGVGVHRFGAERTFNARELSLISFAVEEIRRLVDRGHLLLPPLRSEPTLPPRLEQVLGGLLAGKAPKAIARELGLSIWTVREHIRRLYAAFGVSTREDLMARFINGGG